ncbi:hypothetical protein [uncultured Aliiroseovarius sp.]|uniref:hypothetical protein n=1 Tax=uncultured Aliiroseovarius sp. TaxID=1658783 RepID=UPI0026113FD5|nr:hypothetical protein [uncultured Aliiroseovarius sp.]
MKSIKTAAIAASISILSVAGHAQTDPVGQYDGISMGDLTSQAIDDGFDQGAHASDPSGDGLGQEDRSGLANVIDQGNLGATVGLLAN